MPAIQVARTDTFENQRQKINQISDQIFAIAQGGSDLSTGILKLGDGTKNTPSLAFTNDVDTGLYRAGSKTIGIISNTKLLATFNNQSNEFRYSMIFTYIRDNCNFVEGRSAKRVKIDRKWDATAAEEPPYNDKHAMLSVTTVGTQTFWS